ncbi:hypothetical protein BDC45DRAFT_507865 [Circinella umbellata]|nr:hypothetical protein BDC45DRAFT_507865 [Circinella umbellata]
MYLYINSIEAVPCDIYVYFQKNSEWCMDRYVDSKRPVTKSSPILIVLVTYTYLCMCMCIC